MFIAAHQGCVGAVEPADPTAGMSGREKKMYELQQRLRQSRKANENAVIAEKRRQQVLYCACIGSLVPYACIYHDINQSRSIGLSGSVLVRLIVGFSFCVLYSTIWC